MYIIDKNKDYYDYYSHIYGIDKAITFDRRGSKIINDLSIVSISDNKSIYKNSITHILLEIGNLQYIIKLFDFVFKKQMCYDEITACKMKLMRTFNDNRHYYNSPISIRGVRVENRWGWGWAWNNREDKYLYDRPFNESIKLLNKTEINLPVLKETQITSLIDGKEIWIALNTYFSSLKNDKNVDIKMTDVDRAETHGFDKKTSFRHPVK